jgi:hypothetical protein
MKLRRGGENFLINATNDRMAAIVNGDKPW